MSQAEGLTDAGLRTPRAAAVAGVVFSLLTLISFGLLWAAIAFRASLANDRDIYRQTH